ncbi:hypothetical protein NUW58_g2424 [Xylaria curta]|uniref:Uncharacterized protein n=1 Tax=Xylaria curta TaxID=42375 RepID=A0ACC1PG63_9PEZI|nr:hypothetical protein NUW58_g2424 [Xylaria curta]
MNLSVERARKALPGYLEKSRLACLGTYREPACLHLPYDLSVFGELLAAVAVFLASSSPLPFKHVLGIQPSLRANPLDGLSRFLVVLLSSHCSTRKITEPETNSAILSSSADLETIQPNPTRLLHSFTRPSYSRSKMHTSIISLLFIAIQAVCVYALPPKVPSVDDMELVSFTPTGHISGWPDNTTASTYTAGAATTDDTIPFSPTRWISGWPHSSSSGTSYFTTRVTTVITDTTITVTDNSITWTPTQSISGWPPSNDQTQTNPGQQITETFTITFTSYLEETIPLPPPASVTSSITQSQTPPVIIVTVTASPTFPLPPVGGPSFTIVTVTATPTQPQVVPGHGTATPRFTTITVSEVTIWPSPTTTQTSRLVTLTLSSSSVDWSLNSTTVSYSSTVLTLSPPSPSATGTATINAVRKKRHA